MSEDKFYILEGLNITSFLKVKEAFERALSMPKSEEWRDATILRFNLTFELTWKILKKY